MYESIKAVESKSLIVFNLVSAYNFVLSCFFLLFLMIDFHFLIPAVNLKVFNLTAESEKLQEYQLMKINPQNNRKQNRTDNRNKCKVKKENK